MLMMNSEDLIGEGLTEWHSFTKANERSLIFSLPNNPGIYVIKNAEPVGRLIGESDIFYIGSAGNVNGLKGRIMQYFHPGRGQATNKRIMALLDTMETLEISFSPCLNTIEARDKEKQFLLQYEKEHLELPPLNRRK